MTTSLADQFERLVAQWHACPQDSIWAPNADIAVFVTQNGEAILSAIRRQPDQAAPAAPPTGWTNAK